jgi:hypothetical protein
MVKALKEKEASVASDQLKGSAETVASPIPALSDLGSSTSRPANDVVVDAPPAVRKGAPSTKLFSVCLKLQLGLPNDLPPRQKLNRFLSPPYARSRSRSQRRNVKRPVLVLGGQEGSTSEEQSLRQGGHLALSFLVILGPVCLTFATYERTRRLTHPPANGKFLDDPHPSPVGALEQLP